ncbi:hypothetical protein QJS10_CPA02g00875 [Acorus calamus]|uniref:Uncharacterized protein n=1 Tax=Acorus calamus TaxID=4465 RepID=A0AAV9FCE0_ACOCL|nr:hypothetical protein QJS10_CPA02g00875 [Acorus calamus]
MEADSSTAVAWTKENPRVWGFFGGFGSDACPGGLGRIVFSEGVRVWFLVEVPDSGSIGFKGVL